MYIYNIKIIVSKRRKKIRKTIKELVKAHENAKVYVHLVNDEIGQKFMQQAENEEFLFGDGEKPTNRCYAEIIAVNNDFTINYVNTVGRIAFGSGTACIGNKKLIRVDFEKYILNEEEYICQF